MPKDRWISDLVGTKKTGFRVNRSHLDASGLTAARTHTLPDASGTFLLGTTPYTFHGVPGVELVRPTTPTATVGTVSIAPKHGAIVPIYNPTSGLMEYRLLTQKDWTVSGRTAGAVHDVYAIAASASGVEIAIGPAWTNATTRSLALAEVYGYAVNGASFTDLRTSGTIAQYAGLHVGTVRFSSATATKFTLDEAYLWSRYHQRPWAMKKTDTTTHTVQNTGGRTWNSGTATRIGWVLGEAQDMELNIRVHFGLNSGANPFFYVAADGALADADQFLNATTLGGYSMSTVQGRQCDIGHRYADVWEAEYNNVAATGYSAVTQCVLML